VEFSCISAVTKDSFSGLYSEEGATKIIEGEILEGILDIL